MTPLISIVTATWRRPRMLTRRCLPSVYAQTHRPLEHLVISDGADPQLRSVFERTSSEPGFTIRYLELAAHIGGVGAEPRRVGAAAAAGEWIAYLDDDNEYLPGHIAGMLAEAERSGALLVCTAWRTPDGGVGGWSPPGTNRTDSSSFLHHRSLLELSTWRHEDGYAADGALVDRWVAGGVRWSFLDEPTLVYHGARGGAPE